MAKITPFLWFDDNLEEAMDFYSSIFTDAKISNVNRLPEGTPGPAGKVLTATFELAGQEFMGLNGGPNFAFTEAISFFVSVETQAEVDEYWDKLVEGGVESQCGWLKDKFGLSWQIVPTKLGELLGSSEPEKASRAMRAMLQMHKIDIQKLQDAYDGVAV